QVILRALQQYGAFVADNGSSWYISGVPDERWDNTLLHQLGNVHGSDFEAVDESSLMVDPNTGQAQPTTSTSTGAGYVLDGWGGLHPFDGAPALLGGPYWRGWDIARGLALAPGGGGYVLDGWGGIHAFDGAPPVRGAPYWPGWDIARGIALLRDGTGGYVVDGWGGLHPFAVGAGPMPGPSAGGAWWPGWDIARDAAL